jgi:glycerol kinase
MRQKTSKNYVLAIDEGTTGITALLINENGQVISKAYQEVLQFYPQPGWIEQDPQEIFQKTVAVGLEAIQKANVDVSRIKSLGITNQRETTIVWDRHSGQPAANAISWQCRRTASICESLKQQGWSRRIQEKTGLFIDAYFSATKLRWLLDNIPEGQLRAQQGDLLFGTVDTWLLWNLTGGAVHSTDYSNASRTMLFNIHTMEWDKELLSMLDIPEAVLPRVLPSSQVYGETKPGLFGNVRLPIGSIIGDQQAALFGQACYQPGMAKNTYGTGSFVLVNIGNQPVISESGLITTVAWGLNKEIIYALEGSIFVTGAVIQWLRDGLHLIKSAQESESLANSVTDNGGVYFVPALTGLGAPYWDMYARGTIIGITRGTTSGHLARASLESIAYQVRDVIDSIFKETNFQIPLLRVDGGGTTNSLLMQFQADILGIPIQVANVTEITGLGAGYLAGLAAGIWQNTSEIAEQWQAAKVYEPRMSSDKRETLYHNWKRAIERARNWTDGK